MEIFRDKRVLAPLVVVELISAVFALRDLARRPADRVRGPKNLWRVLIALNAGNSLPYWLFGRKR